MALPAIANIDIYRGDDFEQPFRWRSSPEGVTPKVYIDLTGCVPRAQVRSSTDSTEIIVEFSCSLMDQVATPGGVLIQLTGAQTAALPGGQIGKWDLQLTMTNGKVRTFLTGDVKSSGEYTYGP